MTWTYQLLNVYPMIRWEKNQHNIFAFMMGSSKQVIFTDAVPSWVVLHIEVDDKHIYPGLVSTRFCF
jgi:hypothetical protein